VAPLTLHKGLIDGRRTGPHDGVVIAEGDGGRTRVGALAWALAALSVALAASGVALHVLPGELPAGDYGSWWFTNAVAGVGIALPGGLLAARRSRNPLGWLMLALALAHGVTAASREYSLHALAPHSSLPFGVAALWLSGWTYVDFPLVIPLFFLFPDGLLAGRRWRLVFVPGMAVAIAATVAIATFPGPMLDSATPVNPLAWPWLGLQLERLGDWTVYVLVGVSLLGIVSMLVKAGAAVGAARRGIVLVAIAATVMTLEVGHEDIWPSFNGEEYVGAAVIMLVVLAMALAILRYGLYEIDLVVRRTVVYGGLTVVLGASYVGAVALASALGGSRTVGAVPAAVLVALLFAPVRDRLQRACDRLLFGERDNPYAVISNLGERLDASDPANMLSTLAETVAHTLRLSYVAIELERDEAHEVVAQRGELRGEPVTLPLTYGGEQVGRLSLGPRTPGEQFTAGELRLFVDIARQAAVAAHAVRLTEDLQRSREQLVATREEERRRLHRDLHDGLGPTLAGISLQVGSARLLLTRDIRAADRLLAQLVDETTTAIADVRRLIYALRPPALDELGLVSALRMQAERFPGLDVHVLAPDQIASLPAAVEVAAYRIATEALTNVSRHAEASTCTITLGVDGHLELEVRDDGAGMAQGWRPGVGVASIRERAAELGGTCEVASVVGGGTRVVARLPLPGAA
jgi:two-component system, NarL family, sensor kinase